MPLDYDPLLAKVIASAESRELARLRLIAALRRFPILGIRTNLPFLLRILDHPRFCAGDIDTAFLDDEAPALAEPAGVQPPGFVIAAMTAALDATGRDGRPGPDPWQLARGWRN